MTVIMLFMQHYFINISFIVYGKNDIPSNRVVAKEEMC